MPLKSKFKTRNDAIEEEAKKLQEDEETKLVYQQFIDSFDDNVPVSKSWVKGGTVNPGSSGKTNHPNANVYKPVHRAIGEPIESPRVPKQIVDTKDKPIITKSKRKSNLEEFSEELKRLQKERELRANKPPTVVDMKNIDEMRKSRFDPEVVVTLSQPLQPVPANFEDLCDVENDRTTTNLFLGNLSPELSEQHLCVLFGRYGPLASVKVMWPRNDEEKLRGRNCGFVAFMNRADGERALERLRGAEICGHEMKLGWGKTVLIPPNPVYVPPALVERLKPPPPSGLPFNAQPRDWLEKLERGIIFERKPYNLFDMTDDDIRRVLGECVVKVTIPTDRSLLHLINRMVEFVVRDGIEFEAYIMNKEMRNSMFKFLFDFQSPEHIYYRWKLYSILHGDTSKSWKTKEFRMYKGGPYWRPPPINPYTSGMPFELIEDIDLDQNISIDNLTKNEEEEINLEPNVSTTPAPILENPYQTTKIALTESEEETLKSLLSEMDPGKFSVGEVMVWCLEHADFASEILEIIIDTMKNIGKSTEETEDDNKQEFNKLNMKKSDISNAIALLFLLSDLLHNSSAKVKNASYFRKHMELILPDVMSLYNKFYQSLSSRIKSELFKSKIMSCFSAWGDWYVYPFEFLLKLQTTFLGIPGIVSKKEADSTNVVPVPTTTISPVKVASVLESMPLVDYDGDPLDIDGIPLDESNPTQNTEAIKTNKIDMFDMFGGVNSGDEDASSTKDSGRLDDQNDKNMFVVSKWETVDPSEEDNELIRSRWSRMDHDDEDEKKVDPDADGYPLSDDGGLDVASRATLQKIKNSKAALVSYGGDSSSDNNSQDGIPLPPQSPPPPPPLPKSQPPPSSSSSSKKKSARDEIPRTSTISNSNNRNTSRKRERSSNSRSSHNSTEHRKKHKTSSKTNSNSDSKKKSSKSKESKRRDESRSRRSRSRARSRSRSPPSNSKRSRRR